METLVVHNAKMRANCADGRRLFVLGAIAQISTRACQCFNKTIFNQSNFIRFQIQSAPFTGEWFQAPSIKPQRKTVLKELQAVNNTRRRRLLLKLLKISVDPTDLIGHWRNEWKSQSLSSPFQRLSAATSRHIKGSVIYSKNRVGNEPFNDGPNKICFSDRVSHHKAQKQQVSTSELPVSGRRAAAECQGGGISWR